MRIISQDGSKDFPYNKVSIWRSNSMITAFFVADSVIKHTVLAQYSTDEKAIVATKRLREAYTERWGVFQFPTDDEIGATQ